jgi:uncharacterized membrane-anchored protein YjiN (DUF445 family)
MTNSRESLTVWETRIEGPGLADRGADPSRGDRLAAYRRMQLAATLVLLAMTAIFVISAIGRPRWPWLAWSQAFGEAGMVGACADWFAVVALFRRPLGLPIPHTAILPRNQPRLGQAIGTFVVDNFLTPEVLTERLAKLDVCELTSAWLLKADNAGRLSRQVAPFLPRILSAVPSDRAREAAVGLARQGMQNVQAAPFAAHLLAAFWDQGHAQGLIDRGVEIAQDYLSTHRDLFRGPPPDTAGKWLTSWIDRALADRALDELSAALGEMRRPDHPWREDIHKAIRSLIVTLATDPDVIARGESLKTDLMNNPTLIRRAEALWDTIEADLRRGDPERVEQTAHAMEFALHGLATWLGEGHREQALLNRWIRRAVRDAVTPRREEIGGLIAEVVNRWDAATMVAKIEVEVGRDLQYIRINGAVVGALAGLAIYAVSRLLGLAV